MFEDILKISLAILALTRRDAGKHWRAFLFLLQLLKLIAHRPQAFPRNSLIGLVDVDVICYEYSISDQINVCFKRHTSHFLYFGSVKCRNQVWTKKANDLGSISSDRHILVERTI